MSFIGELERTGLLDLEKFQMDTMALMGQMALLAPVSLCPLALVHTSLLGTFGPIFEIWPSLEWMGQKVHFVPNVHGTTQQWSKCPSDIQMSLCPTQMSLWPSKSEILTKMSFVGRLERTRWDKKAKLDQMAQMSMAPNKFGTNVPLALWPTQMSHWPSKSGQAPMTHWPNLKFDQAQSG